jgi:hypothetical protein
MTPRPDMVSVAVSSSPRRALDLVIADGYSKLPIYDETIDNVIGVVHDRELLIALSNGSIASVSLRSLMRPVTHVPENKRISELLREMQRGKFSLAIVLDEYGGTAGLVTMDDRRIHGRAVRPPTARGRRDRSGQRRKITGRPHARPPHSRRAHPHQRQGARAGRRRDHRGGIARWRSRRLNCSRRPSPRATARIRRTRTSPSAPRS